MQLEREKDTSSMYHRRFRATDMELKDKQKEMVILPSISHQETLASHQQIGSDFSVSAGLQYICLGVD